MPRATALLADAARFTDDAQRHRDARTELRIGVVRTFERSGLR